MSSRRKVQKNASLKLWKDFLQMQVSFSTTSVILFMLILRRIRGFSSVRMSSSLSNAQESSSSSAALIFLHGLGDSPAGWSSLQDILPSLKPSLSKLQFVFPKAPDISISINGNMIMPGWFDLYDWPISVGSKDDKEGKMKAVDQIDSVVENLIKESGGTLTRDRIVIGGFSQGGAIALLSAYMKRCETTPFAGCVALSGWVTLKEEVDANLKSSICVKTPLFWGHGEYDDKVLFEQQKYGVDFLKESGVAVDHHHYPMGHASHPQEMQDFADFLDRILFQTCEGE